MGNFLRQLAQLAEFFDMEAPSTGVLCCLEGLLRCACTWLVAKLNLFANEPLSVFLKCFYFKNKYFNFISSVLKKKLQKKVTSRVVSSETLLFVLLWVVAVARTCLVSQSERNDFCSRLDFIYIWNSLLFLQDWSRIIVRVTVAMSSQLVTLLIFALSVVLVCCQFEFGQPCFCKTLEAVDSCRCEFLWILFIYLFFFYFYFLRQILMWSNLFFVLWTKQNFSNTL